MGLLDAFNSPEMGMAMGLLQAGGPNSRPVSVGQGIAQGYGAFQQAQEAQQQRARRDQDMQLKKMQLGQLLQTQQGRAAFRAKLPPEMQSMFDVAPDEVIKGLFKEPEKPQLVEIADPQNPGMNVKQWMRPGETSGIRAGASPVPESLNPLVQQNRLDVAVAGKAGSPVTKVFNNTKDDFKNERDLRNDFQGLPQTKLFNETQSAYNQIKVGLSAKSAAGDLAAATKFMKMLDPGSVVRESELGMAMAATGVVDRVSNYLNTLKTGEKLTESQRADFQKIADGLMEASANPYSKSLADFRGTASGYGLNPDAVGTQPDRPWSTMSAGGWSAKKVGK